jgi:hypothetical protein
MRPLNSQNHSGGSGFPPDSPFSPPRRWLRGFPATPGPGHERGKRHVITGNDLRCAVKGDIAARLNIFSLIIYKKFLDKTRFLWYELA